MVIITQINTNASTPNAHSNRDYDITINDYNKPDKQMNVFCRNYVPIAHEVFQNSGTWWYGVTGHTKIGTSGGSYQQKPNSSIGLVDFLNKKRILLHLYLVKLNVYLELIRRGTDNQDNFQLLSDDNEFGEIWLFLTFHRYI